MPPSIPESGGGVKGDRLGSLDDEHAPRRVLLALDRALVHAVGELQVLGLDQDPLAVDVELDAVHGPRNLARISLAVKTLVREALDLVRPQDQGRRESVV